MSNGILLWMFFLVPISQTSLLADHFTVIKSGLFLLSASLAIIFILRKNNLYLPRIGGKYFYLISILVFLRFCSVVTNSNVVSWRSFIEAFAFIILCFYFFLSFVQEREETLKRIRIPFILGLCIVLFESFFEIYRCRAILHNFSNECFPASFGNINMLGEYLVLTLPILIYFWGAVRNSYSSFILGALSSSVIFLIWYSHSRSTWIGAGAFMFVSILFRLYRAKMLIALFVFLVSAIASLKFIPLATDVGAHKQLSFNSRSSLVRGAIEYLRNSPFGVGPGNFEFGYVPFERYTETMADPDRVYLDPHNELLRFGIESGWAFLLLLLVLLLNIVIDICRIKAPNNIKALLIGLMLVSIPQILFQFPFQNGFSAFWFCLVLGFFFSFVELSEVRARPIFRKVFLPFGFILTAYVGGSFLIANHLEFFYGDSLSISRIACSIDPANWRACSGKIRNELDAGNLIAAEQAAAAELSKRPFNFVALKYLMIIKLDQNSKNIACEVGHVYHQMFNEKSGLKHYLELECQGHTSPLVDDSASNYKRSYEAWLKKTLRTPGNPP